MILPGLSSWLVYDFFINFRETLRGITSTLLYPRAETFYSADFFDNVYVLILYLSNKKLCRK